MKVLERLGIVIAADNYDWLKVGKNYKLKEINSPTIKNNKDYWKVLKIEDQTVYLQNTKNNRVIFVNKKDLINPNKPEDKYSDFEIHYKGKKL